MLEQFWDIHVPEAANTDSLIEAISAANGDGKPVYMQPATYNFDLGQKIRITKSGFTLLGAGVENTKLAFSEQYTGSDIPCGIHIQADSGQISNVRLADFSVEMSSGYVQSDPNSTNRQGGIYLGDCRGAMIERVNTHGWNWSDLQNPGYGFRAHNSGAGGNKPAGGITFYRCGGKDCYCGIWLTGWSTYSMQRCSIVSNSFSAPGYPTAIPHGYGVLIEQAKGTLILGGQFNGYDYGIYIPPPDWANPEEDQLDQIFGVGFDKVNRGISIGESNSTVYPKKTQVFGVVVSESDHEIVDYGENSLLVSRIVDAPYPSSSLILSQAGKSQFPRNVNIYGTLDAAVLAAAGAGIRTHKAEGVSLEELTLDLAFGGNLPRGFIGIFKVSSNSHTYVVVRSDVTDGVEWYQYPLTVVP